MKKYNFTKIILVSLIFLFTNITRIYAEDKTTSQNQEKQEPSDYVAKQHGNIIILNKITAKSTKKKMLDGERIEFGKISITLNKCIKNNTPYNPDNLMLLDIKDTSKEEHITIFNGWISSANQSISTLEHSVYEVIAVNCE